MREMKMKNRNIILGLGLLLMTSISFAATDRGDGCQTIIGIDMSSSTPWNRAKDELIFAVEKLSGFAASGVKKGDEIVIKPFGSFHDRNSTNRALETHLVRRDPPNKSGIEKKIYSVIKGTKAEQNETSILGFLHHLPRTSMKPVCNILLLTDGFEHSEYGTVSDFAGGKPIPLKREGYLQDINIYFIGFGSTLDSHSSITLSKMESAWDKHCNGAGARCEMITW
jgi:hypothetical protein